MPETRHMQETRSSNFPGNNQNLLFVEEIEMGIEIPRLHDLNI